MKKNNKNTISKSTIKRIKIQKTKKKSKHSYDKEHSSLTCPVCKFLCGNLFEW